MKHVARKRFGQHFLSDAAVIDAIVAAIAPRPNELMVEIGPGLAALTQPLVERLGHLTVIELDRDLAARIGDEIARVAFDGHAVRVDGGLGPVGLQLVDRFFEDFGVFEQVGAHPGAERLVRDPLAAADRYSGRKRENGASRKPLDVHPPRPPRMARSTLISAARAMSSARRYSGVSLVSRSMA